MLHQRISRCKRSTNSDRRMARVNSASSANRMPDGFRVLRHTNMSAKERPLVSIVTPVYNDAHYLSECIESILAQTYPQWEYTILNNCSTDGSAEIARRYAARDARIRVYDNASCLPAVANHNAAIRRISSESKYCKIVFSDDWIFPECLDRMVSLSILEWGS